MEDVLTKATVDGVRIYALCTTNLVQEAAKKHGCSHLASAALGRAMNGALLLAATMKDNERISLRLKGDGLRPLVLSEFGGKTWRVEGHIFNPDKTYGYGACPTKEALNEAVATLYRESILPAVEKGLCAAIYTQVSDVEDEVNGLMTYDRKVMKVEPERIREINRKVCNALNE